VNNNNAEKKGSQTGKHSNSGKLIKNTSGFRWVRHIIAVIDGKSWKKQYQQVESRLFFLLSSVDN